PPWHRTKAPAKRCRRAGVLPDVSFGEILLRSSITPISGGTSVVPEGSSRGNDKQRGAQCEHHAPRCGYYAGERPYYQFCVLVAILRACGLPGDKQSANDNPDNDSLDHDSLDNDSLDNGLIGRQRRFHLRGPLHRVQVE